MRNNGELKWGETPWDHLSREELLRHVQRLYAANTALYSALRLSAGPNPQSPYWGANGTGGRAVELGRQALEVANMGYQEDDTYRAFFRYAYDLLFNQSRGIKLGHGWRLCSNGHMTGGDSPSEQRRKTCWECGQPLRPLTWSDLQAMPAAAGEE